MELQDITEEDLNGILFVEFPDSMSLEESREHLELEIFMAAQEFANTEISTEVKELYDPDSEVSFVALSPMWIWIALRRMNERREGKGMSLEMRKRFYPKSIPQPTN